MATVEPVTPDTLQARLTRLWLEREQLLALPSTAVNRAAYARCSAAIDETLDDMLAAR